ncbi:MAG TPA: hypothetical protein VMU34_11775 [Mycobacterium sp.]|nr:hypothetical protein [Mycobacterium sp.]
MIATVAAPLMHGGATVLADHVGTVAAPLWDIGTNIKNQGITFAVYVLLGGTALVAAAYYFIGHDKTRALKAVAIGIVLVGIVSALPSLGIVAKDTVSGLTNSGGYR